MITADIYSVCIVYCFLVLHAKDEVLRQRGTKQFSCSRRYDCREQCNSLNIISFRFSHYYLNAWNRSKGCIYYLIFSRLARTRNVFSYQNSCIGTSRRYSVARNRRLYERKRGPSFLFLYFCLVHLTTVFSKEQRKVFSSLGADCDMVIFSEDENHSKNSSHGKWMNFLNFPRKLCAVLIQ